MNLLFNTNFIKQKEPLTENIHFKNTFWNEDIRYEKPYGSGYNNFKISTASPCNNIGQSDYYVPYDIQGNPRLSQLGPDVGPYEVD